VKMRAKLFVIMQSAFLGMGLLVFVPTINPTASGKPSDEASASSRNTFNSAKLRGASARKPLAVWECTSSWYGDDFDGQPTANGETYDMYAATAAHPTLPLGSIVRVVNPRNHRSQVVRINDRGPYVEGRELDVSYEVARRLGFDQHGVAKVRLELLEVPARQRTMERAD
jgi:rare lipoprotein A (peptidoglycan hydrolase)